MKLTLIITTYNWPESLYLVILSILNQSVRPYEIIIADDGSNKKTRQLIDNINKKYDVKIIHSWQEDKGFRAARSRNLAISISTGDYIVLVDGDTILHKHFIKDHIANAQHNYFVQGSRVLLSGKISRNALDKKRFKFNFFIFGIKNRKNSIYSSFLSKMFISKKNHLYGIRSCNLAFYKKDFYRVNGFNNDFVGWGREDSEFVARLFNIGINRKNVHFNAIQYHLNHNENTNKSLVANDLILEETINGEKKWCQNGISTIN